jgi:hypothetical protein
MAEERKYGGDAIQAIRTASQAHYHLSAMADRKASMLMGASFVVFTISVSQATARGGELPVPLLVLGITAFLSALFAAIAVMPSILGGPDYKGQRNLMFFGGFSDMTEEEYVGEMMDRLGDQKRFLEMVARDVYQNGRVLADKKYRLLRIAYSIFILGLIASVIALATAGVK